MQNESVAIENATPNTVWILVALGSHVGWGSNPAVARYLITICHLPAISILVVGNALAFLVTAFFLIPRIPGTDWKKPILWIFLLAVALRAVTNMWAVEFTLAIYVQLIYLLSPFVVVIINRVVFRKDLPPFTIPAISLSLVGSLLMMYPYWDAAAARGVSGRDFVGIGLAFLSMLFISAYMILVRRTVHQRISAEALLATQLTGLAVISLAVSLGMQEDWSRYGTLDRNGIAVLAFYVIVVVIGSNFGQIGSIRRLGASLVSSLMASRMVATLIIAALLLGEQLSSPMEFLGAGLVVVTISWYLSQQNKRPLLDPALG